MAEEIKNIDQGQIDNLKENIIKQIKENSEFSKEQKDQFIQKVQSLDNEGFIEFLKKQGIIKSEDSSQESTPETSGQRCIFCSIVFGDTPSWKIAENKKAIAVLEINPLSKGHLLVIPKEHISDKENIPEEAKELAISVSEKIKSELRPKEIKFEGKQIFGHQILNIIPIYQDQKFEELQQKQASQEELKDLYEKLKIVSINQDTESKEQETPSEEKEDKSKEEFNEENTWLPKRIP